MGWSGGILMTLSHVDMFDMQVVGAALGVSRELD